MSSQLIIAYGALGPVPPLFLSLSSEVLHQIKAVIILQHEDLLG